MDAARVPREFNAEVYRDAAVEHIPVASRLYDEGDYVLANYVAGLAVECLLRAYRVTYDPTFDARHDLRELFRQSRLGNLFPTVRHGEYDAYVGTLVLQWSNDHRYRSDSSLRAFMRRRRLHRTVRRGDFLKELTRRMVHAATELVSIGARLWPQRNRQR